MDRADPGVPYDQAAAAAQALRDLGQVPGDDPAIQLEHVVTLLFARNAKLLTGAVETGAGGGHWDAEVLERLDRAHQECLTALAPLTAATADPTPQHWALGGGYAHRPGFR